MKLVVTGATGLIGSEVVRFALRNKAITSLVVLTRRPFQVPEGLGPDTDSSKLCSLIIEDWEKDYPESVKEQITGADACIWFVDRQLHTSAPQLHCLT